MLRKVFMTLTFLMMLLSACAVMPQTRGDFHPLGDEGFQISKAVEQDGSHTLLVTFPDKYLADEKVYKEGSEKVVAMVVGCEELPDCKVVFAGIGKTDDGKVYIYSDIGNIRVMVFALREGPKLIGIAIQAVKIEEAKPVTIKPYGSTIARS
jgi:hypothetical protein